MVELLEGAFIVPRFHYGLLIVCQSEMVTPNQAAVEHATPFTEQTSKTPVSMPASRRQIHSRLAIMMLVYVTDLFSNPR